MSSTTESAPTPPPPPTLPELKRLSLGASIETLLKTPLDVLAYFQRGRGTLVGFYLLITGLFCLFVFGIIVGWYSYEQNNPEALRQFWAAPAKITVGLFLSGLICLPSLYIFGLLSGLDLRFGSTVGVLISAIALGALLLLGFAPVVWIFAQSTESDVFMGILLVGFWCIALYFTASLIYRSSAILGGNSKGHLGVWVAIFALVTFQMSTTLRPIIGTSEDLLPGTKQKMFFLEHWGKAISGVDYIEAESAPEDNTRGWN